MDFRTKHSKNCRGDILAGARNKTIESLSDYEARITEKSPMMLSLPCLKLDTVLQIIPVTFMCTQKGVFIFMI